MSSSAYHILCPFEPVIYIVIPHTDYLQMVVGTVASAVDSFLHPGKGEVNSSTDAVGRITWSILDQGPSAQVLQHRESKALSRVHVASAV